MSADRRTEELRQHWDKQDTRREGSKGRTDEAIRQGRGRAEGDRLEVRMSGPTQATRKTSRRGPATQPPRTPLQILLALRAKIAMDVDFGRRKSHRSYLRDRVLPELDKMISDLRGRKLT